ncbi:MAG: protein-disulfide reductase DsbD domain-containing protein [Stenotrophobium sp.]
MQAKKHTARFLLMTLLALSPLIANAGPWLKTPADGPQILPVDSAFQLMPVEHDAHALRVSWFISKGYYLYRERMHFRVIAPQGAVLGKPELPAGERQNDPGFGIVHVYRGSDLAIKLPLKAGAQAPGKLEVRYQGCAEVGVCYPPQTRIVDIPALHP